MLDKGESKAALRALLRDLHELEIKGFVKESGTRQNCTLRTGMWLAGEKSYEEDLDRLVTFVAVHVFFDIFKSALPLDMRLDIKDVLDRAKTRVASLSSETTTMRWLRALKVEKPYHYFETPIIDGDVRSVVEQAIVHRRKVRLSVSTGPWGPWPDGPAVVSVSHYLLRLPDRPSVVVWRDDNKDIPRQRNKPRYFIIALETILDAELLDESASWPYEQQISIAEEPTDGPDETWQTIEFRASSYQMEKWIGTWLFHRIEIIGIDDEGWSICRVACPDWEDSDWAEQRDNLLEYLDRFQDEVEILAPYGARRRALAIIESVSARYSKGQTIPRSVRDAREESYLQRVYAEIEGGNPESPRLL
jgi:hypothetical protein